jgi:GNAT superfamily N-acetyltransferase
MRKNATDPVRNRDDSTEESPLSVNDRLGLIGLIEEGTLAGAVDAPIVADLFTELWELVDKTVSGSTLDRLKPEEAGNGFRVLEINAESGENLGRLNMIYLNKPMPCYYLVYVEVAPPFRNKGLGSRILEEFRGFLIKKSAIGILDNIIPREDPTFDIYLKKEWRPIDHVLGSADSPEEGVYMVFIPPSMRERDLKDPITRLVHHLRRKRPAIDMRDNELMVKRTIEEFKELYNALLTYFRGGTSDSRTDSLMRFMFTRFVTKLLGFGHRISRLVGYTGGESLGQIVLDPDVRALTVQSYAPRCLACNPEFVGGDVELWLRLPDVIKKHPARVIESFPNYRRPSLVAWMKKTGRKSSDRLTIGDLLDLGFDPTRLKEITLDGVEYIFERIQPRFLEEVDGKRKVLERLETALPGERALNTPLRTNPPLVLLRDRGNLYVLRRKVPGIHWDEALDQLQTCPALKDLNSTLRIDKKIIGTVRRAGEIIDSQLGRETDSSLDQFTFFVAWNLETNQPGITVDFSGSFLECLWIT